ncbi:MAG: V-type ATP synthase subunit A, partial [Candidatus Hydrothermarchaeota archaeon]|nr:V-type ATP synthase subunit A [Candidatus Hydrothermarchaeota archaeon]
SEYREGSMTVVGAVSPPGGDFSEPVTQNTLRITKVFWALDASLADRRHFPSINWLRSYSLYLDNIEDWWKDKVGGEWKDLRTKAMALLQKEAELQEIVQLVGPDALPEKERIVLEGARVIREDFLQQNAYHEVDTYCSGKKQFAMLKLMLDFYNSALEAVNAGIPARKVAEIKVKDDITKLKYVPEKDVKKAISKIEKNVTEQIKALTEKASGGI